MVEDWMRKAKKAHSMSVQRAMRAHENDSRLNAQRRKEMLMPPENLRESSVVWSCKGILGDILVLDDDKWECFY